MGIPKISTGGKPHNDPIGAAKRNLYLIATPVGILSMLAVWEIGFSEDNLTNVNFYILPILAVLFLGLVLLLWRRIIPLNTFEMALYISVLAYALCEFASIIITSVITHASFSPNFTLWLPFVYILGFLVLPTNRAALFSVIFFAATLAFGVAGCIYFLLHGLTFPNLTLLIQVYFACAFYIAVLYLISQIKERYMLERATADTMSTLAMTDSLTQLANRRQLGQYLQEEVARAARHNLHLSIFLFDLDRFKRVNDLFGHNAGDEVLKEVTRELRMTIRVSDRLGRWGGDEFLCLASNTDGEHAIEQAERLRAALEHCHFSTVEKVTASFGVTTYQKGDSPETLIRRADLGLYKAKAGGRNRVEAVFGGNTMPIFEGERPDVLLDEAEG